MTTLLTSTGQLLRSGGPFQYSRTGSPELAANSMPYWAGGGQDYIGLTGEQNVVSFNQLYRQQPWVAILVNKLSRLIATLPLKTYEIDQATGDRQRVRDHPLADLLMHPWLRGAPVQFKQKLAQPVLLHGNSVVVKVRAEAGGPPTGFLPLNWRYVTPHALDQGGPIEVWETGEFGGRVFFAADDVIHLKWEAPDSPLGISPLVQLATSLRLEDAAQRYGTAQFANAARPSGALVLPSDVRMSKPERDELREEIRAQHGGVDNAFKIALLSGGMDWKPFSYNPVEAALIDQRKLNREEVAAMYDVPPPVVGILDHATYSNVAELDRMLYKDVLRPWLTLIEETLEAQLIATEPSFRGVFVEFDIAEVLKGDPLDRAKAGALFITHGIYTINEWRKIENLPTVDNPICNQPLIPVNNMAPATSLSPQLEQPIGTIVDDTDPPATDQPQLVLSSHLARATDRVVRRLKSGRPDGWDRDRFVRELSTDLPGLPAEKWADAIEAGIAYSNGDPDMARDFFRALT